MDKLENDIKSYVRMVFEGVCTVDEAVAKIMYLILTNSILNVKGE